MSNMTSAERMFICRICNASYQHKRHLKAHVKAHHVNTKPFCKDCGKQFTYKSGLTRHIQSVHEGLKWHCDKCDKSYSIQSKVQSVLWLIIMGFMIHVQRKYQDSRDFIIVVRNT